MHTICVIEEFTAVIFKSVLKFKLGTFWHIFELIFVRKHIKMEVSLIQKLSHRTIFSFLSENRIIFRYCKKYWRLEQNFWMYNNAKKKQVVVVKQQTLTFLDIINSSKDWKPFRLGIFMIFILRSIMIFGLTMSP